MKNVLRCLVFAALMMAAAFASAQTVTIPYSMSFEESEAAELANWTLNPGPQAAACNDEWIVGTSVRSDGARSLYVNGDTTLNPGFGTQANLQFAYRDFVLPTGTFIISFDWLNAAPASCPMYVGFVAYKTSLGAAANVTANSTSGVLPTSLANANNSGPLHSASTWQSYTFPSQLTAKTGTTYRFYVAWANTGVVDSLLFGGCIDNIQITDARCVAPSNITAQSIGCDSVILNWTGASDSYEIQYRREGQNTWTNGYADPANPMTCLLEGLSEGNYSFRVRGVCHDDQGNAMYSAWSNYEDEFLIYCNELHCITYFDLDAPGTTCYYGSNYGGYLTDKNCAYRNTGKIDYGPYSELSRHTVNWDKSATDPRTGNQLKLVPTGSIASVRLGNWKYGAEAEAVTYQYTVDATMSILLLKYAVVLEDPSHGANEQPRFVLEILDQNGQLVDPTCGAVNFAAHAGAAGWHTEGSGYNTVTWKDWTTMGLHLGAYAGQTITIRLTTYDCSQSGHYGYAYFTLDCAAATINATSCGENTSLTAEAPDGFDYRWYDESGTTVGTTRLLDVTTSDTTRYTCRLTSKEATDCWFELSVQALPQFPMASFSYKYDPQDCKNRVVFTNTSYIQTRYNGTVEDHYDELGGYAWDFGDGATSSQKNNVHIYPQAGGTFDVMLTGWIGDGEGACSKDTIITITLPELGDKVIPIDTAICQGSFIMVDDQPRTSTGVYTEVRQTGAGCTETTNYNLTVHEQNLTNLPDTSLCFGDVLCIDGTCYDKTTDGQFVRYLSNIYNCDSTVVVNVHFMDEIKPTINVTEIVEDDDLGAFYFSGTGYTYYTVNGVRHTEDSLVGLAPDTYLIIFYNDINCQYAYTHSLTPGCVANMIYQRWNDVLSVKNAQYAPNNRTFAKYQWIVDGLPIEGATKSYYYAEGGLDFNATYEVELTDEQGNVFLSCPFHPVKLVDDISLSPTRVSRGGEVSLRSVHPASVECFNASGVKVFAEQTSEGGAMIKMPAMSGVYVVNVRTDEQSKSFRICVTE